MQHLKYNIGENLGDVGYENEIADTKTKTQSMNGKLLSLIKIKNFHSVKDTVKRKKNKPQTERKYLENTYLIKDLYLNYTKNS